MDGFGGITIGDNVRIAPYVQINTADHQYADPDAPMVKQGFVCAPVSIGDDIWIGAGACINKGVTIGEGSVIGAGAVVTKDIPAFSVAAGNPCRVIKQRNKIGETGGE